ncbi:hypothetical protein [Shewanella acanthi]|uniref:hypothetical protein n=1 Tax=Shewanella acanthi TaxID=2864212 RepID=UPI001C654D95|nr:hypothetical protein [Shewanella acanthi]QYJ79394.1 hypothetical protein K0H61_02800 [Shewanella acanthi]
MRTDQAAEHMLATGKYYTAGMLANELGISAVEASGKLFNIRHAGKYQCDCTPLPNRKVKVSAIKGRATSKQVLWALALFKKPINTEAA